MSTRGLKTRGRRTHSPGARGRRPEGWLSRSHKQGRPWFRRFRLGFLQWRRTIMRNPQAAFVYRWTIGTLGGLIMVIGLVLVPLPGPGWLIVFFGIAIVASEFRWARGLLMWGRALLRRWTAWLARSHWSVSALVGAATAAFVACIVWLSLLIIGLPEWVPHWQFFEWLRLR